MDLYLYVIILYLTTVSAGTIQKIDIQNSQSAIKGTSIKLACYISQFSRQDVVSIYKTDSRMLIRTLPPALTQCIPSTCLVTTVGRYTFSADSGHVYIDITNLHRSEDQKWWTCVLDTQRKDMYLNINTVPQTLQLVSPPNQNQDLAENAVTLRCSTGCTYPQPSFRWYYTEPGGSLMEWSTSGTDSDTTGGCTDSERIYTSTLSLARYSKFPGNLDKTVKCTCGIPTFTGMTQPLYTSQSVDIRFAVQVSSVTLKDGNTEAPPSIKVTSGVPKTLTCTTSASRPTPTIIWFLGGQEQTRSNSSSTFTFIPQNSDYGKRITCKAFNIQNENQAVSSNEATLYFQVSGQDVLFKYDNCYSGAITMAATYTGSGTVIAVEWYYSGATSNLLIIASTCSVFGSVPPGYPDASQMSFDCPSTNPELPPNTFKLTVTGLQGRELENSWGATFSLPVGSSPALAESSFSVCTDPCSGRPCVHGTCFSHQTLFLCQCSKGYAGKLCEVQVDLCDPNPCLHGVCFSNDSMFICQCYNGFYGKTCQKKVDPCQNNPCVHGTCFSHQSEFLCKCQSGYTGERCDKTDVQSPSIVG